LPSSCYCWRSATSRGLAPFSHRSASRIFIMQPGCIPSPMVIQDDDHQFGGGEKQAGLRPLPRPQLQGSSSSSLWRRAGRVRACLCVGQRPASSSGIRRRKASSSSAKEASSSHAGKANCCCRARVQLFVPHPSDGRAARGPATSRSSLRCRRHNTSYAARPVLVFLDGPVLVLVARTGVRTCRCALGQPPLAGAVLVGRWLLSSVLRWWSP
jgi:hypothetical protein